jgi:CheY-like chemotaxis protein
MNQNANTTILIADDDPSHLMLAEAALAGAGFLVHTAEDGEAAVARFAEVEPDFVILDVMMPRLSGIDACRLIRQQAGSRLLPILMLTGRNDLQAISDAYAPVPRTSPEGHEPAPARRARAIPAPRP